MICSAKLSFLVGFACIALAGTARSQDLWQGTTVGMSVDQAKAILPNATAATAVERRGNAAPVLKVSGFQLVRQPFEATLYFGAEGLASVILTPATQPLESVVLRQGDELTGQLRLRYGEPYECGTDSGYGRESTVCAWRQGGADIILFASRGLLPPSIEIHYRAAAADTDNL